MHGSRSLSGIKDLKLGQNQESPLDFEVLKKYMDSRVLRDEDPQFFKKMTQAAMLDLSSTKKHDFLKSRIFDNP